MEIQPSDEHTTMKLLIIWGNIQFEDKGERSKSQLEGAFGRY